MLPPSLMIFFILFYRLNHWMKLSLPIPMNNNQFLTNVPKQAQQLAQLIGTCRLTQRKLVSARWCRRAV